MTREVKKIGLFGGTFDPPHWGHVMMAQLAMERCGLSRVIFIPCRRSPLKAQSPMASDAERAAMLKLALKDSPQFEISRAELEREEPSYSYLTAEFFHRRYPRVKLFWILGSDQWATLEQWKNFPRLRELVTFVVFPRPHPPRSKRRIRCLLLDARVDISATMIRERLRKKLPTEFLLPPGVDRYIRRKGLYS